MWNLPPIVSLVPRRFEDGAFSGVPRFDRELRRIFPTLVSLNTRFPSRLRLKMLAKTRPDSIVITGNETSLLVPDSLRTIVVHHGCAQTHLERDPTWRRRGSEGMCQAQAAMYERPNRWYVATALWTAQEFSRHYRVPEAPVIPSWVEPIPREAGSPPRPVILGDWRDHNKGRDVIPKLAEACPEFEFRPLVCTYNTRAEAYGAADAYLCLSLSEGGAFSVADAEAAALPLVTTDVGNHAEYTESHVIRWQDREDVQAVGQALGRALSTPRGDSFFASWTLDAWRDAWHQRVATVADQDGTPPLRGRGHGGDVAVD